MSVFVYRYGLLPPILCSERVSDQMHLAHKYQNTLVALERARRDKINAVVTAVPEVAPIAEEVAQLEASLEKARSELSKQRGEERSRDAGDNTEVKGILAKLRPLWKALKQARKEAFATEQVKAALAFIDEQYKADGKAARKTSEVYWGTYLQVEAAVYAAKSSPTPPSFRRWRGDGSVAVQLQGGLSVDELVSCADTRLRLVKLASPVPDRGGKALPRLFLRVGSEGRDPIFAEWPIVYHRPLPPNAEIKMAKVVRQRVGTHNHWSLHLTLQVPDVANLRSVDGDAFSPVAVNLRWAKTVVDEKETTLAADWTDGANAGEVTVHPKVFSQLQKSDDLRSIRDRQFNAAKGQLQEVLKKGLTFPLEHMERLEFLHAWKSSDRLAGYTVWWRSNRFDGDREIFETIEAWRKQDKHLFDWEANSRRKALARRRDGYRVFASQMVRKYNTLVLEKINISRVAEKPKPEDDNRDFNARASYQRFATAPSELRSALLNAFKREGLRIVEVPAGLTSAEMLAFANENGGEEKKMIVTRSAKFKRLRKIPVTAGEAA